MHKVVISGYYGFGNAGDEAMLAAIIESLLAIDPDLQITVISGHPEETRRRHGVEAVSRLQPLAILRAIGACDLLLSGGGSLLQNVTSQRSVYYYIAVIKAATLLGKPVMLYGQGIGPLYGWFAQRMVAQTLRNVDIITVRDSASKDTLQALGIEASRIHVTADAVLSMHPVDVSVAKRLIPDWQGTVPLIGVSVRKWRQHTAYRSILASVLDRLQRECQARIVFIPMQHPDDTQEAEAIAACMQSPATILAEQYTTTELLAVSGIVDLMIGIRLHALIFASLMERPVIGLSYDPKIDNFLTMIGRFPSGTLEHLDEDSLYHEAKRLLERGDGDAYTRIRQLRQAAMDNAKMAISLLHQRQSR